MMNWSHIFIADYGKAASIIGQGQEIGPIPRLLKDYYLVLDTLLTFSLVYLYPVVMQAQDC